MDLLEDNNSDFNNDYFAGNISCKNVKVAKKMEISPKKFDSSSNFSLKENFSFSNIYNKNKIVSSPKINYIKEKRNVIEKNYNLKYLKNLNCSQIENQNPLISKLKFNKNLYLTDINIHDVNEKSFLLKNKNRKYELTSDSILKEKTKYFSPRTNESKFI